MNNILELYVGLDPYLLNSADLFYGRSDDISDIVDCLKKIKLSILYGESGVGKSSILRAGVAYQIKNQRDKDTIIVFPPDEKIINNDSSWSSNYYEDLLTLITKQINQKC